MYVCIAEGLYLLGSSRQSKSCRALGFNLVLNPQKLVYSFIGLKLLKVYLHDIVPTDVLPLVQDLVNSHHNCNDNAIMALNKEPYLKIKQYCSHAYA